MASNIEFEQNSDGSSTLLPPKIGQDIDYKKDWKVFVITDKKKLDKIVVEMYKKIYYTYAYEYNAKINFDSIKKDGVEYHIEWYIYNIPTKEKVKEVYDYIKKKSSKKFIADAVASYDEKYKYELVIYSNRLSVPYSTFLKVKVSHKEVSSVYNYKTEKKRFFRDLKKAVHELSNRDRIEDLYNEISSKYTKKYHTIFNVFGTPHFVYTLINVPPDDVNMEAREVGYMLEDSYVPNEINIIGNSTIEVVLDASRD